jgi:glycosyltransferase involved in cell wall biosynthesis
MNYWLLTSEYPPFFGGGISTYCLHTATMLTEKGYAVSVFVNDSSVKTIEISESKGVRVIRFNPSATKESSSLGHVTGISFEFANIIKQFIDKEGKPHIIEAQEYLGIAYYLLQYKKLCYSWCNDIPVIITMHSPSFLYMEYNHISEYRYPNYWICEMERFCLQAADHVISPSLYMVNELGNRFQLSHSRVSVIPNPFQINKTLYEPSPHSIDKPGEIIFYGKLTAQKGAFQLLSYFKQLWDSGFSRTLTIIGGQDIVYHPEGKTMGDIIKKNYGVYIDSKLLVMEDRILPSQLGPRLKDAELMIIPSNNDNLPYVIAEVMSLGKIVLASKQGGHSEVLNDGINGFLFDHRFPETFFSKLKFILSIDKETYTQISGEAIKRVNDYFNYTTVFKQKEEIIRSVLKIKLDDTKEYPFIRQLNRSAAGKRANNEKLSIVIPYFNLGVYLSETVASIKESNYTLKEIIIVNDGSTDKLSLEELEKWRGAEDVIVVDTNNKGIACARNTGALRATGDYLAFLDADDKISPDYYSKAIRVLNKYDNIHFVGCWVNYFGDSFKIWPAFNPEPPLILYHNLVNSSALVYKRESFLCNGLNDSSMLFPGWEDYESVVSMVAGGNNGVVLPETLFMYRIRKNSMVRMLSREKKILLHQFISQKHTHLYSAFTNEIFNLQNTNGPSIETDNPSQDYYLADYLPWKGKSAQKIIRLIKKNKHIKGIAYKVYRLLKK